MIEFFFQCWSTFVHFWYLLPRQGLFLPRWGLVLPRIPKPTPVLYSVITNLFLGHVCIGMSCLSWQWHRTGSRWFPVRTLPVAPFWCDLGFVPNSRGNPKEIIPTQPQNTPYQKHPLPPSPFQIKPLPLPARPGSRPLASCSALQNALLVVLVHLQSTLARAAA